MHSHVRYVLWFVCVCSVGWRVFYMYSHMWALCIRTSYVHSLLCATFSCWKQYSWLVVRLTTRSVITFTGGAPWLQHQWWSYTIKCGNVHPLRTSQICFPQAWPPSAWISHCSWWWFLGFQSWTCNSRPRKPQYPGPSTYIIYIQVSPLNLWISINMSLYDIILPRKKNIQMWETWKYEPDITSWKQLFFFPFWGCYMKIWLIIELLV